MKKLVKKILGHIYLSALHIPFVFLWVAKEQLGGLATCGLLNSYIEISY
jgi:hypothetical protein